MQPLVPASERDGKTVLDREFGAATLSALRAAVLEAASAAGLDNDRAIDVLLAMHELAANVVRHGAGHGRLQIEVTPQVLRCQVTDGDEAGQASQLARAAVGGGAPGGRRAGASSTASWPVEHGHGLWLVRRTADQIQVATGPGGSAVCVIFLLRGR
jgi:anti-sigma regulatory factor (Ser/Thr protein kinase)